MDVERHAEQLAKGVLKVIYNIVKGLFNVINQKKKKR